MVKKVLVNGVDITTINNDDWDFPLVKALSSAFSALLLDLRSSSSMVNFFVAVVELYELGLNCKECSNEKA